MLTDEIIVLCKSWVVSRRPIGKGSLIMCKYPLQITDYVMSAIGDTPVFSINTVSNGVHKEIKAVRINRDTVCWE